MTPELPPLPGEVTVEVPDIVAGSKTASAAEHAHDDPATDPVDEVERSDQLDE